MIEIIPAIDLIDGKCVRLSQGDFTQRTIYSDNPTDVAKRFEDAGLRRVHIVDLDGAKSGKITNLPMLESIAKNTALTIDFGGGIKSFEDIQAVFDAGAAMANIGSIAVRSPVRFFEWLEFYGSEKILLGSDVRNGFIFVDGWQTSTELEIIPFLHQYFGKALRQVFVTDITKDGLLQGPSLELYKQILRSIPEIKLIASGGVSSLEEIDELEMIGCSGVIIGKAIYEGKIDLSDLIDRQNQILKKV